MEINITRASVKQGPNKRAYFHLSIEVANLKQLNGTLGEVKKIDGVVFVERIKEYERKASKCLENIEAEKSEKLEESKRIAQSKQFIESSQICGFCEFGNRPNATFCGGCGKPLGDIICTNCQFENPNIASFCEGCGQRLGAS